MADVKNYAIGREDIDAARERIAPHAHVTPVSRCATLDELAGCQLFFKCEHLQKGGAFKFRGAVNAVLQLSEEEAQQGVITHSSGNHAQALALAARIRGIKATIVMPENGTPAKIEAVKGYGANVVLCTPTLQAREESVARILERSGGTFIHPYNHPHIMAGQGTTALELMEQVPGLDAVVVPVGGGGLLSGVCVAIRSENPDIKVFAAEPKGADDVARSIAAGHLIPQTNPVTIADGLLTSMGPLTWPVIRDSVEEVLTVSEDEIISAMRLLWERAKLLVEPSAAVPFAAILSGKQLQFQELKRVGVVLSGGNSNLDALPWL